MHLSAPSCLMHTSKRMEVHLYLNVLSVRKKKALFMTVRLKCVLSPSCYRIGLALHSPASPTGPLPGFLGPQLQQQYQSGSSVVAEGRRRAKLSFPCSPHYFTDSYKVSYGWSAGCAGAAHPGWEGCADTRSPKTHSLQNP